MVGFPRHSLDMRIEWYCVQLRGYIWLTRSWLACWLLSLSRATAANCASLYLTWVTIKMSTWPSCRILFITVHETLLPETFTLWLRRCDLLPQVCPLVKQLADNSSQKRCVGVWLELRWGPVFLCEVSLLGGGGHFQARFSLALLVSSCGLDTWT